MKKIPSKSEITSCDKIRFSLPWTLRFFICIAVLSCRHEEDPLSFITSDEFFLEARDAQAAVDAIYQSINSGSSIYSYEYITVNAMASDIGTYEGGDINIGELVTFSITPHNQILHKIWSELYEGINTANHAIHNIPAAPLSEPEKMPLIAEARFLRAMFYFDLMRFFGGVPIVKESFTTLGENYLVPRASVDSLQQFLEQEFTYCFENLPRTNNPGRPINITAAAYLAKFYLTIGEYTRAFQASRTVIQSSLFSLLPDYANLFTISAQNTPEDIWSVNINESDPILINHSTLPKLLYGTGFFKPTESYFTSFVDQDRRKEVTFFNEITKQGQTMEVGPHIGKFWDSVADADGGPSGMDLHLIRYADILLCHAEAINELRNGTNAESLQAINLVRARSRFNGNETLDILPDLGRMGKEAFRHAILEERARELGWEGHRWFDLVRMGLLKVKVEEAKSEIIVEDKHSLFPIPSKEFLINPNIGSQNPGY